MTTIESYQRRVAEVLELTMKNDRLIALLRAVLDCPTYSEQTNAIVVDAKTVGKIRDEIAPLIYLHIPGRGDPAPTGNCELKISLEQRNMIVRALECLHDVNRS